MTPEQKKLELQRYRSILLATLDYLEKHLGSSILYDQYDPVAEYYQQQKIKTEKYFKHRKLDRLHQQFATLTKGLQNRVDLKFPSYIKEKTGYDIDIFEDRRKRVDTIIGQNEIRGEKELNDVGTMLRYYQALTDKQKIEKLNALLTSYFQKKNENDHKRKSGYSEVISREEKDGIEKVTVRISTGPKPKHFKEQQEISPDGKHKLYLTQWSDGKNLSTYVTIEFSGATGPVYGTTGVHSDIKAWWKDNSTIVIETKREYEAIAYKEVRSFDEVINIDYIEH